MTEESKEAMGEYLQAWRRWVVRYATHIFVQELMKVSQLHPATLRAFIEDEGLFEQTPPALNLASHGSTWMLDVARFGPFDVVRDARTREAVGWKLMPGVLASDFPHPGPQPKPGAQPATEAVAAKPPTPIRQPRAPVSQQPPAKQPTKGKRQPRAK